MTLPTRWAPTIVIIAIVNPLKGLINSELRVIALLMGVMTPFRTGGCPPCNTSAFLAWK